MGYSSNQRFSPLTDNINLVIDGCGNTYEEKYYVNGAYIDLCGLPIEEYMKSPCCGGSGDSGGDGKTVNKITVISYQDEKGTIFYKAVAKFPVTSNIKIEVMSGAGIITELDIYAGNLESEPEIGETLEITGAKADVVEDENFQYVTITGEEKKPHEVYYTAMLRVQLENLTSDSIKTFNVITMSDDTTSDLRFVIPGTDINYNEMTDMAEFDKFCIENEHCLVLVLPKITYDDKAYIISNYGGSDITNKFSFVAYAVIDGVDYVILSEKADDDIMPFVPLYNEELVYNYKLTFDK